MYTIFFFFFKQKTAYEMRISDWSSDVCSSDLNLRDRLVKAIAGLRVGISTDPEAEYGPVVSAQHKARIEDHIQVGVDEGAELVIDGRGFSLQGYEEGYFLGPTLFDHVTPAMRTYQEEIFGPVLQIVRATTSPEAVALASGHQYGNG